MPLPQAERLGGGAVHAARGEAEGARVAGLARRALVAQPAEDELEGRGAALAAMPSTARSTGGRRGCCEMAPSYQYDGAT